jgi:hypothetical protein
MPWFLISQLRYNNQIKRGNQYPKSHAEGILDLAVMVDKTSLLYDVNMKIFALLGCYVA